jgi:lipopolysaccharide biosynthesis glycosyltransferase
MNICYCLNNKHNEICRLSAKSFVKYNPNVNFYILHSEDSNFNLGYKATVIKPDMRAITDEFSHDLLGFNHLSMECFLRLLISRYITSDRVLYVDTDTLCLDNIEDFYNTDFENNYFVGVRGISYSDTQAEMLGIPYYINSGVLLMNNELLKKSDYWEYMRKTWRGSIDKQKPFSADETVINYCFHDKIKLASQEYNYCYDRNYGLRTIKSPKILHFTGCDKSRMFKVGKLYEISN